MNTTNERVLLVDDDANVLRAYERRLRRRFEVETALCSEEGLTAVNFLGPFAVIVSDMTMPRENGADFLARMLTNSPESVRIMLTGNADQATAAKAVNRAHVFRFLNKPCPADDLEAAIEAGIGEHRRLAAERELRDRMLAGAVDTLRRALALASPEALACSERLRHLITEVAGVTPVADRWCLETAAEFSQLGALDAAAKATGELAYGVAAGLVSLTPGLEGAARVLAALDASRGGGLAPGADAGVTADAALLRAAIDFDRLTTDLGLPPAEALHRLIAESPPAPHALEALRRLVAKHDTRREIDVQLDEVAEGMRLMEDVVNADGLVLVAKGQDFTPALVVRLRSYSTTHKTPRAFRVLAPNHVADAIEAQRSTAA